MDTYHIIILKLIIGVKALIIHSGVILLFEYSTSWASEVDHFGIFSCPQENQVTRQFYLKFNFLLFFLIS